VYYAAAYRRLYLLQRAEATQASLDALRAQLHPHFLFNTLNTVSVLAEENPPAAGRVLLRLSELLRTVLRHESSHEVSLQEEVVVLESYLEIQRVRFEERLVVDLAIAPGAGRALVPWLVLQPLVENALRYAVEPRAAGGRVIVSAERLEAGDRLRLVVEDDGPGLAASDAVRDGGGVGLANTRARLARLYGDRHDFRIESGDGGGCRVVIELPFREAP
jgi:LytS/YehU family sensor histidine kinase